jgi:5-methylcytosine-specific restriction enzyme A
MVRRRPVIRQQPPRITTATTRITAARPKETLPFYRIQEWVRLVARIIAKRGRRCEGGECKRINRSLRGERIFADHIIEIQDGGALLDEENIKLLCGSCHHTKTLQERARRMRQTI